MKRPWIKIGLAVAAVSAIVAMYLLVSLTQTRNSVDEYREQLRAAGERLELREVIPARLPPEQNSAPAVRQALAILQSFSSDAIATNTVVGMHLIQPGLALRASQQPDVRNEFATNSWKDFEMALAARTGALELLTTLPEPVHLDFELNYRGGPNIPLLHLAGFKSTAQLLASATVTDLHRRQTASAVTNLHAFLALARGWETEPLYISQLVRIAAAAISFNAQWEIVQDAEVTGEQLALLQRDWTALEFVRPMETSFEFERIYTSMTIQQLRTSNNPAAYASLALAWSSSPSGGTGSGWLDAIKGLGDDVKTGVSSSLWRAAWSFNDERNMMEIDQVLIETARQIRTNGFFMDALEERTRRLAALGISRDNWLREKLDDSLLALFGEDSLSKGLDRAQAIEIQRQLAITAIAIKRFTLAHHRLPENLDALAPEFLRAVPRDPVDGKPLRYRANPDGAFLLYSVGKNGVDEGGNPFPASGASKQLQQGRDMVWPRAATPQEVSAYLEGLFEPPK